MRCDIFCAVVDNYGDIGVCWRLARQLTAEHDIDVRLWVDDLSSLYRLWPDVDPQADAQYCADVEIRHWAQPFPDANPADVVIEAFGCNVPERYQAAMARLEKKPVWINLEYLSAELWVEGCHSLSSPHPRLPLTKHFFFPGFTPATGGLLRENDLLTRRDTSQRAPDHLWQSLNLPGPAKNETTVSLFSYDTAPISSLLTEWQTSSTPVSCLLPEGRTLAQVAAYFGKPMLTPGDIERRGNLTLHVLPFLQQESYDRLLWACDCNFVRGEDSFVRAQWAAKPFVWQIYPQQENAHRVKLDAFLDRYCTGLPEATAAAVRNFHHGWNAFGSLNWNDFWLHRQALKIHSTAWAGLLAEDADLASKLVIFCKNRV